MVLEGEDLQEVSLPEEDGRECRTEMATGADAGGEGRVALRRHSGVVEEDGTENCPIIPNAMDAIVESLANNNEQV